MPDDVQPGEGQGSDGTGSPYDSYLQAVPDEARGAAEQWFRDTSKSLDAKLEEAAQLRTTFGPYKDVDLTGYDPETLSQLVTWHQQITQDPNAFKAFIESEAREMGITPAEAEAVVEAETEGATPQDIQQLVQRMAEERLAPIEERFSQLEQEKQVDVETQAINQAFGQIQAQNGLELTKDQKAVILDLGMPLAYDGKGSELPMGDASWVQRGFDRWKEIQDQGNRLFVEQKAQMPGGALSSGGTAQAKPITSFEDANLAMRERLRQQS